RDPVEDGFVIAGSDFESQSAAMRYLLGGLGKHQAAGRVGAVEAAAGEVVEERFVVKLGVVAAQREFETIFTLGGSVAGPRGAAHFVQYGRDVAEKSDFGWLRCACHAHQED